MDLWGLVVLAVFVVVVAPLVLSIVSLVRANRLKQDVATLSAQLSALVGEVRGAPTNQSNSRQESVVPDPSVPEGAAPDRVAPEAAAAASVVTERPAPEPTEQSAGPTVTPPPVPEPTVPAPPPPQVPPGASPAERLFGWLAENWIMAIAAGSLALAGLFLVQYGVESGIIGPAMRVVLAAVLGLVLVASGERLRRRGTTGLDMGLLPQVMAAGGLVTLYGAVLGAFHLYGLLGQGLALVALAAVSLAGLAVGGRQGQMTSAMGTLGGLLAPFVIGGGPVDGPGLLIYFAAIILIASLVAHHRTWRWLPPLAVLAGTFPIVLAAMSWSALPEPRLVLILLAGGAWYSTFVFLRGDGRVLFDLLPPRASWPPRAAIGGYGSIAFPLALAAFTPDAPVLIVAACAALVVVILLFTSTGGRRATSDAALLPVILLFSLLPKAAIGPAELGVTLTALAAVTIMLLWSAAGRSADRTGLLMACAGVVVPGLAVLILEILAPPTAQIGALAWAVILMGTGAALTAAAAVLIGIDKGAEAELAHPYGYKARGAVLALGAIAAITLSLFTLLSGAGLTLALAVSLAAVVLIDRRLNLPFFETFALLGLGGLVGRLVVFPGIPAALTGPALDVTLAFSGVLAVTGGLVVTQLPGRRPRLTEALAIAGAVVLAAAVSVALFRATFGPVIPDRIPHWMAGLLAVAWGLSARTILATSPNRWRVVGGVMLATVAAGFLLVGLGPSNPLLEPAERILGPVVLSSLVAGYLLPAALLWFSADRAGHGRHLVRGLAAALGVLWVIATVRHLFHGSDIASGPIMDGEHYVYSLLLILGGVALLVRSWRIDAPALFRQAGFGLLIVAIVKVFFVDAAALVGVLRVLSFLALGLALAGLGWLDRRVRDRQTADV